MKQRKFKFSLGMKIASILSCIALVSVGFASWWIVQLPQTTTKHGSFEVYEVETKQIKFNDIKFVNEAGAADDANITFGYPSATVQDPWVGYDSTKMAAEDLEAIMQFTVALSSSTQNDKISNYMSKVNIDLTIPDAYKDRIVNTSAKTGYVAVPVISYRLGTSGNWTSTTPDVDGAKYSIQIDAPQNESQIVQVKFEFGWSYYYSENGDTVITKNPYTYFNGLGGYTVDREKAAKGVLDEIYKLLNAQFDIKLSSTPEGPAETTAQS